MCAVLFCNNDTLLLSPQHCCVYSNNVRSGISSGQQSLRSIKQMMTLISSLKSLKCMNSKMKLPEKIRRRSLFHC